MHDNTKENRSKKTLRDTHLSVLDLCLVGEGYTAADAIRNTIDLAQHAEKWGYRRYWLAEHHNFPAIASSATSLLIGHVAGATSTIRVGSGGIMLPNHAPLIIAEQFGTLETIYPGRIDLGLGRAPGTDAVTAQALRRNHLRGQDFPELLAELRGYFNPSRYGQNGSVHAYPGEGLEVPIWLLGSSGFSAQLAGQLGLPFAFASHFSPENTLPALELYRRSFRPSEVLQEPYVIVAIQLVAAESDDQAAFLATTLQQQFLSLVRNQPGKIKPPTANMDELWSEYEKEILHQQLGSSIIGGPEKVRVELERFIEETQADELMLNGQIYEHQARLRSYEIVAEIKRKS